MPTRVGVLASYDYPEPRPVAEWLDELAGVPPGFGGGVSAAQAPSVQARPARPGVRNNGDAQLTPEQIDSLMDDRRAALPKVLGARVDIANLLKERQPGYLLSPSTRTTENRFKTYFDSTSDETVRAVDAHLQNLEGYLRDPGNTGWGEV